MKNGLPVVADDVDLFRRDAALFAGVECGFGVDVAQAGVELAEFTWSERILFGYAEDFFADGGWEILTGVAEELDFQVWRSAGDSYESGVDAVGGGAGHHAEDEHGVFGHENDDKNFYHRGHRGHREEEEGGVQRVTAGTGSKGKVTLRERHSHTNGTGIPRFARNDAKTRPQRLEIIWRFVFLGRLGDLGRRWV